MRSKSYDRVSSRVGPDHFSNERAPSQERQDTRGNSVAFEFNKRDFIEKDRLIESKNREIVKLRMENDELKQDLDNGGESLKVTEQQRFRLMNDLDDIIENMRLELERTKANLCIGSMSNGPLSPPNIRTRHSTDVLNSEDAMVSSITHKIKSLRTLMSLTGEVFLLSSKNKYAPK